jgi:hypothetical protein
MNVGDEVIIIGDSIYYNGYRKGTIGKIIGKCYSDSRSEYPLDLTLGKFYDVDGFVINPKTKKLFTIKNDLGFNQSYMNSIFY